MAYNIGDRFPHPPKYYRLFEPGAYQYEKSTKVRPNKAPFLSNKKRDTQPMNKIWTDTIYYTDVPPKIPNCTALISKLPRFPYEKLSEKDIKAILCKCGIQNVCECSEENDEETDLHCHAKIRRRLFKGHPPRSVAGEGLAIPSRQDYGFELLPNGNVRRILKSEKNKGPPFYDAVVHESTAFYHGWKWSKWKSSRSEKVQEQRPGPADYTIERQPTDEEICAEAVRAHNRKNSKQLRFIEMIQQKTILEDQPGPASYNPKSPRGTNLLSYGSNTSRFKETNEQRPSPADHWIRRDFDLPAHPDHPCHAKLPKPSCFGVNSIRFKPRKEAGPSPATYNPSINTCYFMHCPTAPFGCSSERFKSVPIMEENNFEITEKELKKDDSKKPYFSPTWEFKSKTIRMKPLVKKLNEQSPADFPQQNLRLERAAQLQFIAPFFSSEGRFVPWKNWMNVIAKLETPGPGYYNTEKPTCVPAVCRGPLARSQRFAPNVSSTPGPGKYNHGGGIENILTTHNQKLKHNIENQHKFHWEPPVEKRHDLSLEEREALILKKCIDILNVEDDVTANQTNVTPKITETHKPKLLRYFLYRHPVETFY